MAERERSQLHSELAMLHGYTMILMGELRAACIPVLPSSHIPSRGPIVPLYKSKYMPTPLSPLGGWDFFAQTQGPPQDPGYTLGTSGSASPFIGPFTGDDDDDTNQYIGDDDSQQGQPLLQHDVAPAWACMYVYYSLPFDRPRHVCIILPHNGP